MRKIFAIHDGGSGCSWYRMIMPMDELARHGEFEITYCDGDLDHGPAATLSEMAGHDIIVGQRINLPKAMEPWRRARGPFSRLVYEIDDNVFEITPENWAAYHLFRKPEIRDAIQHCAEVADLVTVSTPELARVFGEFNSNVVVLPNHVPDWVVEHERFRHPRPRVGWMGGASHGRDIHLAIPAMRRFLERFPGWDANFIGTDYRPSLKHERATYTGWTHVTDNPEGFYKSIDFDIGVAPLLDAKFARAKSFLKCLELGALGIPVVASDVEPYRNYVRHGETGFLARRDHEWLKYLSELASDAGLREKMGAAAREQAREYTIGRGWKLWDAAYRSLFS